MPEPSLTFSNPALSDLNRCSKCGQPTHTVHKTCHRCLAEQYYTEVWNDVAEQLRTNPQIRMELARDRSQRRHLVCFREPQLTLCRMRVTESRRKRVTIPAGVFPAGTCALCLDIYWKLTEKNRAPAETAE
jgi:hypothetical protein